MQLLYFCVLVGSMLGLTHQQCAQQFLVPNIMKDLVTLVNNFDGLEGSNSYPYFSRMFTSTPKIAYSISQIDIISNANSISYYLDVFPQTFQIVFFFNAVNQNWTTVSVNIWLTSHPDIITRQDTIHNIGVGQNSTQIIPLVQSNATLGSGVRHVVFIVGVYANTIASNFTLSVQSGGANPSFATILVRTGQSTSLTNITVTSIIFDPVQSQLLSYAGTVTYSAFTQQYLNLYNQFVPIYYYLVGMSAISTSGTNAKFYGYKMGLTGTVLDMSILPVSAVYQSIGFSYVTIGVSPITICSKCGNNFISGSQCLDICPFSTYRHNYADGAKACLSCPDLVGLKINDLADGCNCLPGYQVLTKYQCLSITTIPTTCSGQNVIQNGTQCICSPGTFNISGLCQACPVNTFFDGIRCQQTQLTCTQLNTVISTDGTQCICISGFTNYSGLCKTTCQINSDFNVQTNQCECLPNFMNISNACISCKSDQSYDPALKSCRCLGINQVVNQIGNCVCAPGFNNITNFCIQCPTGTIFLNGKCTQSSCQPNQIFVNGVCVCDGFSVKIGSVCVKCNPGTFPNTITQTCEFCMANCVSCTNALNCDLCLSGYIYDFTSKSCLQSGGSVNSIKTRNGFPIYTPIVIVTDFDITSIATLSFKSRQQLATMITIDFTGKPQPLRVISTQNVNNLNSIRIVLDYRGLLPLSPFNLNYTFQQPSINLLSSLTVNYNTATAQITTSIPD